MGKNKKLLADNTVIVWKDIPVGEYRKFFEHGICTHDRGEDCRGRKTYTIDGKTIEKCNGTVFEFHDPKKDYVKDYIDLMKEFYFKHPK